MSARTAIIAALPREIAGIVRDTKPDAALRLQGIYAYSLPQAVVVAAGMGAARVKLAVEAAMRLTEVSTLVSVGLAGGCSPEALVGSVLEAKRVVSAQSGESYATEHGEMTLVTTTGIAGVREKLRLRDAYQAAMVDMEAATVARLGAAHHIPFRAIKAISDGHDFELASLGRFTSKHGHFATGRFALHTAVRPHTWSKTMRLGRHSAQAMAALAAKLQQEFQLK